MGTLFPFSNKVEKGWLSTTTKTDDNAARANKRINVLKTRTFFSLLVFSAETGNITFKKPFTQKKVNAPAMSRNVSYNPILAFPSSDFESKMPIKSKEPYLISWKS